MLTKSGRSFQNPCALETGLSDFHKMTVTVLKSYLEKKQPKIISRRDFGKFSDNDFRTQILRDFSTLHLSNDSPSLHLYVDICIRALDVYAPKNKKYLRANSSPFMNKTISKAVMDCTRLRNKFLKNRTAENKLAYNCQRIYCVPLTHKPKRDYYNNLDNRNVTDNKLCWKTVKLFLSDKGPMRQKITLFENDKIIGNNKEISEIFNNFFSSIVAKLNIPKYEDLSVNSINSEDPLENLIIKYKNHPSTRAVLDKSPNTSFSLKAISKKDIEKDILILNVAKASQDSDIPTKIIKKNSDIFSDILFKEFKKSLEICKFPSCLKMATLLLSTKKE